MNKLSIMRVINNPSTELNYLFGENLLVLGEVEQAPRHVFVYSLNQKKIIPFMIHLDDLREATENEF